MNKRKVDLIVEEMKRYDVKVTALQETKWFGCEVYQVGGSVILTSGREKPAVGESIQRGEGVAIVLTGPAVDAWRRAGRQWKAWSSRMVSACLQVGEGSGGILHVVSCYAPTRAASREMKDAFFLELEHMLSSIPSGEKYVVLGDFNARVGSREYVGDHWDAVRGPHGFGVVNDAGKELLSFLSVHQATVCNTWFRKKAIHKQTWQHPKSKQWSCIDYVLTRQRDRRMCLDVAVKRGAECNTDHQFVCARIRMAGCNYRRKVSVSGKRNRYDVSKLARVRGGGGSGGGDQSVIEEFQDGES